MDERIRINLNTAREAGVPVPDKIGVRIVKVSARSGDPVDPEDRTGSQEKLREASSLNNYQITLSNIEVELVLFGQRKRVVIASLTLKGDPSGWPAQIVQQVPELRLQFELYARIREARTNPSLGKKIARWLVGDPEMKALREVVRLSLQAINA